MMLLPHSLLLSRHFFKINISGVHTEYFLLSGRGTAKTSAVVKPKVKKPPPPGRSGLRSVTLS